MNSTARQMEANAHEAMKLTRKHFVVELDFSDNSVQELEGLVDDVDFTLRGGKSDENIELLTRVWGSYLGEVIRRQLRGQWLEPEGETNPGAMNLAGSTIFPLDQVRQRLMGDADSNLWTYFQRLRDSGS